MDTPENTFDIEWQGIEYRMDMKTDISEWIRGPGSITHSRSVTIQWTIEGGGGLEVIKDYLNVSLKFSFSRSYTETNAYTVQVKEGEEARLIYVPRMHHFNGWLTEWESIPVFLGEYLETHYWQKKYDRAWRAVYFPLPGGQFQLEHR